MALFGQVYGWLSAVVVLVNVSAESLKGYKTLIETFDVAALFYLCFFDSWFRSRIILLNIHARERENLTPSPPHN
jgi:hypothetical protein